MDKNKLLDAAKLDLFIKGNATFILSVLFSLEFKWDTSTKTASTDGKNLFLNAGWFSGLTKHTAVGLLLHEAWHVALEHMLRLGDKDPSIWNDACDHFINLRLTRDGFQIPEHGLCDTKYTGWTDIQIYEDLLKEKEEGSSPPPPTKGSMGGDLVYPESEEGEAELAQQLTQTIINAATQAEISNDAGSIPGDMRRRLDDLLNPKLPWEAILLNWMYEKIKEDYTWTVPNRRYAALDILLPSLDGEGLGGIAFYTDSSGSVSDRDFLAYITEMNHILELLSPKRVSVAEFDTDLREPTLLEEGEGLEAIEFSGYGGTCITDVMNHIQANDFDVSVIFTDGYFTQYIPDDFDSEIIWVIVGNKHFDYPVGEIVYMDAP